ncbi:MAG: AAA family ATPase [Anaerolineae bacterium]
MIESIHIRDFRGIQGGVMDRLRQFNILVGPNNSGKSAVLEALYLASTAGRPASCTVRYRTGDRPGREATYDVLVSAPDLLGDHPIRRLWDRHNYPGLPPALTHWSQGFVQVTLRDQALPVAALDLYAGERGFAEGEEQFTALLRIDPPLPADQKPARPQQEPVSTLVTDLWGSSAEPFENKRAVFCWHPDLSYYYRGSSAWLLQGTPAVAEHTLLFDADLIRRHTPLPFYQRMLSAVPGWTQRIARSFGRIFGLDSFTLQFLPSGADKTTLQGLIAPEDRPAIPIDAFGDGARSAFKLLTPLIALTTVARPDAPGLLLWEEPESYQNPQTLARLLQEVFGLVRGKPIQVFMATHSLEVVAQVTAMLQAEQLNADEALLFRLDLRDGKLISSWFDKDNLIAWLESGLDPRTWQEFVSPVQFRLRQEEA